MLTPVAPSTSNINDRLQCRRRLKAEEVTATHSSQETLMAKLDGKIALISGGTSGIGAATAKLFQSEGATVVVTGSSERSVEAAKSALPGIEVLVSDAGDVAATKVLVDQVKAKHGRIDVLFVHRG